MSKGAAIAILGGTVLISVVGITTIGIVLSNKSKKEKAEAAAATERKRIAAAAAGTGSGTGTGTNATPNIYLMEIVPNFIKVLEETPNWSINRQHTDGSFDNFAFSISNIKYTKRIKSGSGKYDIYDVSWRNIITLTNYDGTTVPSIRDETGYINMVDENTMQTVVFNSGFKKVVYNPDGNTLNPSWADGTSYVMTPD